MLRSLKTEDRSNGRLTAPSETSTVTIAIDGFMSPPSQIYFLKKDAFRESCNVFWLMLVSFVLDLIDAFWSCFKWPVVPRSVVRFLMENDPSMGVTNDNSYPPPLFGVVRDTDDDPSLVEAEWATSPYSKTAALVEMFMSFGTESDLEARDEKDKTAMQLSFVCHAFTWSPGLSNALKRGADTMIVNEDG